MNLIEDALTKAMPRIAIRLQNELRLKCPVKTGTLRRSLRVIPTSNGLKIIANETLLFVEFGTNPHTIEPSSKKALKYQREGEVVFSKKVKHPGNKPNPFVRATLFTSLRNIIKEEIMRELNDVRN